MSGQDGYLSAGFAVLPHEGIFISRWWQQGNEHVKSETKNGVITLRKQVYISADYSETDGDKMWLMN